MNIKISKRSWKSAQKIVSDILLFLLSIFFFYVKTFIAVLTAGFVDF